MPFREKGEQYPGCGSEVRMIVVVGGAAYFCPACQRRR